jgi:hypothetical protein
MPSVDPASVKASDMTHEIQSMKQAALKLNLSFKSQSGWEAKFAEYGFKVRSEPCSSPIFADILYVCEK